MKSYLPCNLPDLTNLVVGRERQVGPYRNGIYGIIECKGI